MMQIKIPTNFNFYQNTMVPIGTVIDDDCNKLLDKKGNQAFKLDNLTLLRSDLTNYKHLITSSVARKQFEQEDKKDDLILRVFKNQESENYYIQSGLFTGVIYYQGVAFNIVPHCGEFFLDRMLNMSNHIYLDNDLQKAKTDNADNPFLYIIIYLFVNALDKASVLGYPQQYRLQAERCVSFHGQLNIAQFVKSDIPFNGKLSVVFRERQLVQEIVDVLYSALRYAGKSGILKDKIRRLKTELQPYFSGTYCNSSVIRKALKSHSLNNPMYRSFRNALRYAEILLGNENLTYSDKSDKAQISGFLIDASELWEVYLEKLLMQNFPAWNVMSQEKMPIYHGSFFERDFFPDLVMKRKDSDEYAVFDAKFKRMMGKREDVDRGDLHQIHTYASYYERFGDLKACGLIYPCDVEPTEEWTSSLFKLDNDTRFFIDGINTGAIKLESQKNVSREEKWSFLLERERSFINRMQNALEE